MTRRSARGVFWFSALLILSGGPGLASVRLPNDFINEVIVNGLAEPTSFAFLPDGRVLLIEQRTGKVRLVVNGHLSSTDPVLVPPQVNADAYERGLEGITVDPRWPARPYVYLYYTRTGSAGRLVRYTASGDLINPLGQNLSLSTPLLLMDDIRDDNINHNGGCLRFAPDGSLFLGLGDDEEYCDAADSTTLRGCLLRLNVMGLGDAGGGPVPRDSITPGDNPLATADSNARLVYAYGLRNPWRFQIEPTAGGVYLADVGLDEVEEINEVHPRDYLGWPWREGNVIEFRQECQEPGGMGSIAYTKPIVAMTRGPESTAIVSAGMYRPVPGAPANWPADYNGHVFYSEYYSGFVRQVVKSGSLWQPAPRVTGQPDATNWATGLISAVDFLVGPDGSLWWLRQFDDSFDGVTGSLQRIRYIGQSVVSSPAVPRGLALLSAPNPFRSSVDVAFTIPSTRRASGGNETAYVRLELYDPSGRLVRRLLDASVFAGEHHERWDGLDQRGRPVAPGVYLVRLETPLGVETARLLRLQ